MYQAEKEAKEEHIPKERNQAMENDPQLQWYVLVI